MSMARHTAWFVTLAVIAAAACRGPAEPGPRPGAEAPGVAAVKNLLLDVTDVVWDQRHLDRLGEFYAADVVRHVPGRREPVRGLEANRAAIAAFLEAFPGARMDAGHVIAQPGWGAIQWVFSGQQRGALDDIPATGRPVRLTGVSVARIEGGKIVEIWDYEDRLLMFDQLGVSPPPPPGP